MAKREEWLVTDSCAWYEGANRPKDYNSNAERSAHIIECVSLKTGTIKYLSSGSRIIIVKENELCKLK